MDFLYSTILPPILKSSIRDRIIRKNSYWYVFINVTIISVTHAINPAPTRYRLYILSCWIVANYIHLRRSWRVLYRNDALCSWFTETKKFPRRKRAIIPGQCFKRRESVASHEIPVSSSDYTRDTNFII